MSEEKTSNLGLLRNIIGICIIVIGVQVGIVLFGSWFEADKSVLKDTAKAQEDIGSALFLAFNDFGRLEVRYDYSVRVYISKKSYMLVPYPDRDKAISTVGRAWCDNESVNFLYMPKVVQIGRAHV